MARTPASKKDTTTETPTINALMKGSCKTLSGTAEIIYQIGIDDSGSLLFQMLSSTGGGLFSTEWVSFTDIQATLKAWPADKPINSLALKGVFTGQSANNGSFLMACLLDQGLVETLPKKKRCHQACDPTAFLDKIEQLKSKKKPAARKKPTARAKKPVAKKKAAATRKKK